jgi:hypothetical protein
VAPQTAFGLLQRSQRQLFAGSYHGEVRVRRDGFVRKSAQRLSKGTLR